MNFGVDEDGKETAVAWRIVSLSPESTALRPEETRVEKLGFAIDPRDGRQFTVRARMRYRYAPAPTHGGGDAAGATMAESALRLPGKRPSS